MTPGARNLITDVPGVLVGNAEDRALGTGTTVLTSDAPFAAAVHVMGGAPGTRETDLLAPESTVQQVDALVLSGGSAFGLQAGAGAAEALRKAGRGFSVGHTRIPIVPSAILFDLGREGGTEWTENPWYGLGQKAVGNAGPEFAIGSVGVGTGATTANLMGGLGSASEVLESGVTVGALVGANPVGRITVGDGPQFWAAPFEAGDEFGGLGPAKSDCGWMPTKVEQRAATVIAIVATDLALTKSQAKRLAVMAHDGIARAAVPSHTPFDGDLVFAASTGARHSDSVDLDLIRVGHAAATCLSRAMARAVFEATPRPGQPLPTWREKFGH